MAKLNVMPPTDQLLPGRDVPMVLDFQHLVYQIDMRTVPTGCEVVWLGLGCFWGAERLFWQAEGIVNTAVGYAGGVTKNPNYEEVCSGFTGHTEIVQVAYDPTKLDLESVLKIFWEAHDPTQGMRQGSDVGTQYRSAIYGTEAQLATAEDSKKKYQIQLNEQGLGEITTELSSDRTFYYAEEFHQQYLQKNPNGYCGLKGTGVVCPI